MPEYWPLSLPAWDATSAPRCWDVTVVESSWRCWECSILTHASQTVLFIFYFIWAVYLTEYRGNIYNYFVEKRVVIFILYHMKKLFLLQNVEKKQLHNCCFEDYYLNSSLYVHVMHIL